MTQQIQPPQLQQPIGQLRKAGPSNHHEGRDSHGLVSEVFATLAFNQLLQQIVQSTQGLTDSNGFTLLQLGPLNITIGSGDPNGVVTGSPPDLYLNTAGGVGTTLWYKSAGSGTTANWTGA